MKTQCSQIKKKKKRKKLGVIKEKCYKLLLWDFGGGTSHLCWGHQGKLMPAEI